MVVAAQHGELHGASGLCGLCTLSGLVLWSVNSIPIKLLPKTGNTDKQGQQGGEYALEGPRGMKRVLCALQPCGDNGGPWGETQDGMREKIWSTASLQEGLLVPVRAPAQADADARTGVAVRPLPGTSPRPRRQ